MNEMFENFSIDMIALESAITLFEVENDITPDYLASSYSRDEAMGYASANESAADDDFFANIFNDDIPAAPATEGSGESFGSRLANGIKKIAGAIKNFFIRLAGGLKKSGEKVEEISEKAKDKELTPAEQHIYDQARDVRAMVTKLINILTMDMRVDIKSIKTICDIVNVAISKGKVDASGNRSAIGTGDFKNGMFGGEGGGKTKKNNQQLASDYADAFTQAYADDKDHYGYKDASTEKNRTKYALNDIDKANAALDRMTKIQEDLMEVYESLKEKLQALDERILKELPTVPQKLTSDAAKKLEKDKFKRDDLNYNGTDAADKEIAEKNKHMFDEADDNSPGAFARKGKRANIKEILTKAYYIKEKGMISNLQKLVDEVVTACQNNVEVCTKIMNATKDLNQDNDKVKIAYESTKIYKNAATVFGNISKILDAVLTGKIYATIGGSKVGIVKANTTDANEARRIQRDIDEIPND